MNFIKSRKVVYSALASLFAFYGILAIAIPLILELPFKNSPNWWNIFSDEYWRSYYHIFISGFVFLGISLAVAAIYMLTLKSFHKLCSMCNNRYFTIFDKASKLSKLSNLNEYSGPGHNTLCPKCWKSLTQRKCSFCDKPINLLKSKTEKLLRNYEAHGIKAISSIKYVCASCYKIKVLENCDKCGIAYPKVSNKKSQFYNNKEIRQFLCPYHSNWSSNWNSLCPSCYNLCCESIDEVKNQMKSWVFGTREERVDHYEISDDLGWVEVNIDGPPQKSTIFHRFSIPYWGSVNRNSKPCINTAQVEDKLRLFSAQKGGNAYINCAFTSRTIRKIRQRYKDRKDSEPLLEEETESTKTFYGGSALAVKVSKLDTYNLQSATRDIFLEKDNNQYFIIDGSNVCRYNSGQNENKEAILCHVLSLCNMLSEADLNYRCYFDANLRYVIPESLKSTDLFIYDSMLKRIKDIFFEVPGSSDADAFILQDASHNGAYVITNDNYKPYREQHEWLNDKERLIKFMIKNETIIIPDMDVYYELYGDAKTAFDKFQYLHNNSRRKLSSVK